MSLTNLMSTSDAPTPPSDLGTDTLLHALSNERRRVALMALNDCGPIEFAELVRVVAALVYECDVEAIDEDQRRTVYASLYQSHIPQLEEAGIVERRASAVALSDTGRQVVAVLEDMDERYFGGDD